jgi:hypothetical protein
VESLEEQTVRVLANLRAKANPLEQYRYLSALQNENETLFYRVALDHLEETLPIIYTPTVGQACLEWSRLYERPRGLYISAAQHAGRVADLLRDWPRRAGIIVVTDSGRISPARRTTRFSRSSSPPRRSFFPGPSFSSRTSTIRAPSACCGGTGTGCAASTTMCRVPARWDWPGSIRRAESPGGH